MKSILHFTMVAVMMLAAFPQYSSAQNAGCPEQHRKEGDNHVGFQAGTNPKFFCVRNVKISVPQ